VVTAQAAATLTPVLDDDGLTVAHPRGFDLEAGVAVELHFADAADVTLPVLPDAGTLTVCGVGGAA